MTWDGRSAHPLDLGNLAKGQSLHVSDLQLGANVKVVTHGKPNPAIVSVTVPVEEEEVAAPVAAAPAAKPTKGKKSEKQNQK